MAGEGGDFEIQLGMDPSEILAGIRAMGQEALATIAEIERAASEGEIRPNTAQARIREAAAPVSAAAGAAVAAGVDPALLGDVGALNEIARQGAARYGQKVTEQVKIVDRFNTAMEEAYTRGASSINASTEAQATSAAEAATATANTGRVIKSSEEKLAAAVEKKTQEGIRNQQAIAARNTNPEFLEAKAQAGITSLGARTYASDVAATDPAAIALRRQLEQNNAQIAAEARLSRAQAYDPVTEVGISRQRAANAASNALFRQANPEQEAIEVKNVGIASAQAQARASAEALAKQTEVLPFLDQITKEKADIARLVAEQKLAEREALVAVAGEADFERVASLAVEERAIQERQRLAIMRATSANEADILSITAQQVIGKKEAQIAQNKITRAMIQQGISDGTIGEGTLFQRAQSYLGFRAGNTPRTPEENATLGQFIGSKALTTAGFAISGGALFGALALFKSLTTGAEDLEHNLALVKEQFDAAGRSGDEFGKFKNDIIDIAKETGVAADQLALMGQQLLGVFRIQDAHGNDLGPDPTRARFELQTAAKLQQVSPGLTPTDTTNNLTAFYESYKNIEQSGTFQSLADDITGTSRATGVMNKELVDATGNLAPFAAQLGITSHQLVSYIAAVTQGSGLSGTSAASSLNRFLGDLQTNEVKAISVFQAAGGNSAAKVAQAYATQNYGTIIETLIKEYQKLGPGLKDRFAKDVIGSRNIQGVIGLFTNPSVSLKDNGRTGELDRQFGEVSKSLKVLRQEAGQDFKQLADDLYKSGLGKALEDLAIAGGAVLKVFSGVADIFGALDKNLGGIPGDILGFTIALLAFNKVYAEVQRFRREGFSRTNGAVATKTETDAVVQNTEAKQAEIDVNELNAKSEEELAAARTTATTATTTEAAASTEAGAAKAVEGGGGFLGGGLAGLANPYVLAGFAAIEGIQRYSAARAKAQQKDATFVESLTQQSDAQINRGAQTADPNNDFFGYLEGRSTPRRLYQDEQRRREAPTLVAQLTSAKGLSRADLRSLAGPLKGQASDLLNQYASDKSLTGDQRAGLLDAYHAISGGDLSPKGFAQNIQDLIDKEQHDPKNRQIRQQVDSTIKVLSGLSQTQGLSAGGRRILENLQHIKTARDAIQKALANQAEDSDKFAELQTLFAAGQVTLGQYRSGLNPLLVNAENTLTALQEGGGSPADIKAQADAVSQILTAQTTAVDTAFKDAADTQIKIDAVLGIHSKDYAAILANRPVVGRTATTGLQAAAQASLPAQSDAGQAILSAQYAKFLKDNQGTSNASGLISQYQKFRSSGLDQQALRALLSQQLDQAFKGTLFDAGAGVIDTNDVKSVEEEAAQKLLEYTKQGIPKAKAKLLKEIQQIQDVLNNPTGHARGKAYQTELRRNLLIDLTALRGSTDPTIAPTIDPQQIAQDNYDAFYQTATAATTSKYNLTNSTVDDPKVLARNAVNQAQENLQNAIATKQTGTVLQDAYAAVNKAQHDEAVQLRDAGFALQKAQANGDPIKIAAIDLQQAIANHDQAGQVSARNERQQALADIQKAQLNLQSANAAGDPVELARLQVLSAEIDVQNAHGQAAELNALAAKISAKHNLAQAIIAALAGVYNVAIAVKTAAGDTVGAAALQLELIEKELAAAQQQGDKASQVSLLQQKIQAQAALRDANLTDRESDIDFALQMQKITTGQAIQELEALLKIPNLTKQEIQQLQLKIKQLRDGSGLDPFNVPSDLNLPTLYEVRRIDQLNGQPYQSGGRRDAGVVDNSVKINIIANNSLDAQKALKVVTNAITAAPRSGVDPTLYI